MCRVLSVAKELVRLSFAGDEKDPLTNLRLQKLLCYAQAWSLVLRESELFPEEIEARRCGPVVPVVYRVLPDAQAANQIPSTIFSDAPDLPPEDAALVRSVWEAYNQYSALQLSRMTHEEAPCVRAGHGPPDATGSGHNPIDLSALEDYFGKQAVPAPLAAFHFELRKREEEAARTLADLPPLDPRSLTAASKTFTPAAHRLFVAGE